MDDLVFFLGGGSCSGVGSDFGGEAVMKEVRIYQFPIKYRSDVKMVILDSFYGDVYIMLHQVSSSRFIRVHPYTVYGTQPSSETVGGTIGFSTKYIHPFFSGASCIFVGHQRLIQLILMRFRCIHPFPLYNLYQPTR